MVTFAVTTSKIAVLKNAAVACVIVSAAAAADSQFRQLYDLVVK